MPIELVPHKFQGPDLRCPELFHPNNVEQVEKELDKSWRITWYIVNWTLRICYIFFNRANQIDSHIKKWNKQITQLESCLDVEAVGKGKDREIQAKITELFQDYRANLEILRKELDAVKKCSGDEAKMRLRPWIYRRWVWLVEQNLDGVAKKVGTFKKSETVEIGTHRMVFVDLHNKLKEEFEKLNGQLNPEVEKHLPKTFFDTWKELASHLTNKKPPDLGKLEEWKREVSDHIDSKVLELQTTLTEIQTGLQNLHSFPTRRSSDHRKSVV